MVEHQVWLGVGVGVLSRRPARQSFVIAFGWNRDIAWWIWA